MPLTSTMRTLVLPACGAVLWLLTPRPSLASDPTRGDSKIAASIFAGYAHQLTSSTLPSYRFGIGGRFGWNLGRLDVGGAITWHFGSSEEAVGPDISYESGYHLAYGGPEAGYNFSWMDISIRPYLQAGVMVQRGHTTVGSAMATDNAWLFYGAPGVFVGYRFGRVYAGLDARGVWVPARTPDLCAVGGFALLGVHLD